jgi:hypothetical protein
MSVAPAAVAGAAGSAAESGAIAGLQASNTQNFLQQIAMTEMANKQTMMATVAREFGKVGDAMASVSAK